MLLLLLLQICTNLLRVGVEGEAALIQLQVEPPIGEACWQVPVVDGTVPPCGLAQPGRGTQRRVKEMSLQM